VFSEGWITGRTRLSTRLAENDNSRWENLSYRVCHIYNTASRTAGIGVQWNNVTRQYGDMDKGEIQVPNELMAQLDCFCSHWQLETRPLWPLALARSRDESYVVATKGVTV
jgi:hypothetical protein